MKPTPSYRLGFAVLAHESPELCARLVDRLLSQGDAVALHLDKKADRSSFETALRQRLGKRWLDVLWADQLDVRWAEWSMVEATLSALQCFTELETKPAHVILLSGSDYPIRPIEQLRSFLSRHAKTDFIDHHDAERERWVAKGAQQERYRLFHWLNWRRHPRLFELSMKFQSLLGIQRKMPAKLHPHLGSQWWALTWESCQQCVMLARQKEVYRFFKRTWVPDELYFQSVCASRSHAKVNTDSRLLTHVRFGKGGSPIEFFNDHFEYLTQQPFFFARKMAPNAENLRDALDRYAASSPPPFPDQLIGQATSAMDDFFAHQRQATHRHFLWGQPGEPPLGEMRLLQDRYAVVVAEDRSLLQEATLILRGLDTICWHGELFAEEQIDYAPGQELAEYPADNVLLRDQDSLGFLAAILRSSGASLTGFCWQAGCRPEQGPAPERESGKTRDVLAAIARDFKCHLIYIGSRKAYKSLLARLKSWDQQQKTELLAQLHHIPQLPSAETTQSNWQQELAETVSALTVKPQLLLHIGMQRTGSTSLQRWLQTNSDALADEGVCQILPRESHSTLSAEFNGSPERAQIALKHIVDCALSSGRPKIILSDEDLVRIRDVQRLEPLKAHFTVKILCYLRQQDAWLESWYNQMLKWPWTESQQNLSAEAFLEQVHDFDWLDYQKLLDRWKLSFGREAIRIALYETQQEETELFTHFYDALGISASNRATSIQRHNRSLCPDALVVLRNLPHYHWPKASRIRLINALAAAYENSDFRRTELLIDDDRLQEIQHQFDGSNAAVARDYFGNSDGLLFLPRPRDETRQSKPAELPSAEILTTQIAPAIVLWFLRQLRPEHIRNERLPVSGSRFKERKAIQMMFDTDTLSEPERAVWREVGQTRYALCEGRFEDENSSEAQLFLQRDLGPLLEVLCAALARRQSC